MITFVTPACFLRFATRATSSTQPIRMCSDGVPRVNRDVVAHTAKLANLKFLEEEIDRIVPDFDNMLRFVDSMNEFHIDSQEQNESSSVERRVSGNILRHDSPAPFPYVYVNKPFRHVVPCLAY